MVVVYALMSCIALATPAHRRYLTLPRDVY